GALRGRRLRRRPGRHGAHPGERPLAGQHGEVLRRPRQPGRRLRGAAGDLQPGGPAPGRRAAHHAERLTPDPPPSPAGCSARRATLGPAGEGDPRAAGDVMSSELTWHHLGEPRGRGWPAEAMDRRYDRLPAHARDLVPEVVWGLSRHSSSLFHEFETDATELHARWEIRDPEMVLGHMPATATAGLDLYAQSSGGTLRWVGSAPPGDLQSEAVLAEDLAPGHRR